ncbi:MAG: prepilin peptidase [Variibacter sp.]|nr:prepilin peptidase [Variibacter sp.]
MISETIILLLFPALMAFAACSDLVTMTISNRVALALVIGFFVLAVVTGMSAAAIASHVGAGLLVLVLAFLCFTQGWIGGGDAKLAAASVLWLGPDHAMAYLIWASLLGGVLTVIILKFRLMPLPAALARQEWLARLHRVDAGVPYGIALAAAALLVYPDTAFMQGLRL